MNKQNTSYFLQFIPIIGIVLFFIMYWFSASLYPGGSQENLQSIGFDWYQNYWCDLLELHARNGLLNPARPYALTAMLILCLSLAYFFYLFPKKIPPNKIWKPIIIFCGTTSMFLVLFVFTAIHNSIIISASFLGLLALLGVFNGLRKQQLNNYLWMGWSGILLIVINNIMYYSKIGVTHLAFIQKISFAWILLWIIWVNLSFKTSKLQTETSAE